MTNDQINAAIAQACGWMDIEECTCGFKTRGNPPWYSAHKKHIPNYCNDLNAMHEAEDELSGNQYMVYANILGAVEGSLFGIRATARQRAEAFLRTLEKWEPVVKECFTTEADHLRDATKKVGEVQP